MAQFTVVLIEYGLGCAVVHRLYAGGLAGALNVCNNAARCAGMRFVRNSWLFGGYWSLALPSGDCWQLVVI